MDKKPLNTIIDFEMADGSHVGMTLAFYALYQLKNKKKSVYERYNKIMTTGPKEELDNVAILYTAYLCANIQNVDECMDEMEFMQTLPVDREQISNAMTALINPKKAKVSGNRS